MKWERRGERRRKKAGGEERKEKEGSFWQKGNVRRSVKKRIGSKENKSIV